MRTVILLVALMIIITCQYSYIVCDFTHDHQFRIVSHWEHLLHRFSYQFFLFGVLFSIFPVDRHGKTVKHISTCAQRIDYIKNL